MRRNKRRVSLTYMDVTVTAIHTVRKGRRCSRPGQVLFQDANCAATHNVLPDKGTPTCRLRLTLCGMAAVVLHVPL